MTPAPTYKAKKMNKHLDLSGPIRANQFAMHMRIANILGESIRASKNLFFLLRIDLPENG